MPFILLAVGKQVAVQLPDMVFRDWDVLPGVEHLVHYLGIADNLLFVAGGKGCYFKISKQLLSRVRVPLDLLEKPEGRLLG